MRIILHTKQHDKIIDEVTKLCTPELIQTRPPHPHCMSLPAIHDLDVHHSVGVIEGREKIMEYLRAKVQPEKIVKRRQTKRRARSEPAAEPVAEPVAESEPVAEPVPEPVAEPVAESESVAEPVAPEPVTEPSPILTDPDTDEADEADEDVKDVKDVKEIAKNEEKNEKIVSEPEQSQGHRRPRTTRMSRIRSLTR